MGPRMHALCVNSHKLLLTSRSFDVQLYAIVAHHFVDEESVFFLHLELVELEGELVSCRDSGMSLQRRSRASD